MQMSEVGWMNLPDVGSTSAVRIFSVDRLRLAAAVDPQRFKTILPAEHKIR